MFISHVASERPIALLVQDLLKRAFPEVPNVFVSSDDNSIPTGASGFREIISSLQAAAAVIVLLSPAALRRPWISFELGVSFARVMRNDAIKLLPLTIRSQDANVGTPFAQLQVRRLSNEQTIRNLIRELGTHLQLRARRLDFDAFLKRLDTAEQDLQRSDLHLQPVICRNSQGVPELFFDLIHPGAECVRIRRVVVRIPEMFLNLAERGRQGCINVKEFNEGGYRCKEVTPDASQLTPESRPRSDVAAVPQYIAPEHNRLELPEPRFLLRDHDLRSAAEELHHRIDADGYSATEVRVPLKEVDWDSER